METRYFIELMLFLMLAVLFQYQIGKFQTDFAKLQVQFDVLNHMKTKQSTTPAMVAAQRTIVKDLMN
jgi:hypothetical protein